MFTAPSTGTKARQSRSPHGERGLKFPYAITVDGQYYTSLPARGAWIEIVGYKIVVERINVAPRTGSVD